MMYYVDQVLSASKDSSRYYANSEGTYERIALLFKDDIVQYVYVLMRH